MRRIIATIHSTINNTVPTPMHIAMKSAILHSTQEFYLRIGGRCIELNHLEPSCFVTRVIIGGADDGVDRSEILGMYLTFG